jgi:dipeptidyl aminopeptidase/acylaminoacyl peptidase
MKIGCMALAATICLLSSLGSASAKQPPLIPREILFGNPERANPHLSPDGKMLAYLAPDKNNVLQVWLRTVGKEDDQKMTDDKKRGIRQYFWAYDNQHLLYVQDADGDENFHVYAVAIKDKEVRDLTPFKGARAQGIETDPSFPNEILVGLNVKDKTKFDMYRIDLKSGEAKLDTENPGRVVGWVADPKFQIRAGTATTDDGGYDLLVRESTDKEWKKLKHWDSEEQGEAIGFSDDGKSLFVIANHDANAERLLSMDIATGKEKVIAEDSEYDVGGAMAHPTKHIIQAVAFNRDKVEWQVLDKTIADDFKALAKAHNGEFNVVSRDLADKTWLVVYTTDDGPATYYSYDRESKQTKRMFSTQPKLEGLTLAAMKPISYKSRDGLTIHGYLTLPPGVEAKNLPTVLLVHGGPWGRDSWGFNNMAQWLANRGYAVLQVNFRGSTGYGKKFLNAGNREWAGKMHNDLIDGVDWIVKEGVADSKKVAIMGGSYGGYATLVGLTFTPDTFCCGVDIVGPSNIITLLKSIPPYWKPILALFAKRVGDPEKDEEFLKSCSPLYKVDKIKSPLLIGQGANDPRVKQAESDQIVEAMRKEKKPVEYIVFTDEGHGFARPENRMFFNAKTEEFLAKYLGGRSEPLGEIKGHSGVVK